MTWELLLKLIYACGVVYTGRKISASLGYVAVRGEGKMEIAWGSKTPSALSLPLPSPPRLAGRPLTCVFVTVNGARRYLAESIPMMTRVDVEHVRAAVKHT